MDLEGMADGVRFYQSQAFFKEPGDMGSAFHTDNYACPLDTSNQLTTAWLPLVETDREMGMLAFARGSHADMNIQFWNNGTSPVVYRADLAPNGKSNRTGGVSFVGNAMGGNALSEEDQATGEHGVCTCRTYVYTQQYLALV